MHVWRRLRESWRISKRRKDAVAMQQAQAQREAREQKASEPAPLPAYEDRIGQGPYINPF